MTAEGSSGTQSPEPARLASNSTWSLAAQAFAIAVNAGVAVVAVRTIATDAWGNYSTAMSMVSLATFVADLGVATHILREMSLAPPTDRPRLLGLGLSATAQLGLLATGAIVLGLGLGWNGQVAGLVLLALPLLFLTPGLNVLSVPFNAARLMRYSAMVTIAQAGLFGGLAIVGLLAFREPWVLVGATVGATAVAICVALRLLVRRLYLSPRRPESSRMARRVVRAAVPLTLIGAIGTVYARLDILLLAQMATPSEVARYSVPFSIVQLAYLVPSLIGAAFFPLLAELLRTDPDDARSSMFLLQRLFFAVSVPAALLLGVGAGTWLTAIFGDRYADSVPVAEILAWTLVLTFQTYVLWYAVLATGRERGLVAVLLIGLLANLGLNLALIPSAGAEGAAIALLVTDTLVILGEGAYVTRTVVRLPVWAIVGKPALVGVPAVGLAMALKHESPLGAAVLASGAYLAGLAISGYIRTGDLRPFIEPFSQPFRR